MTETPKNISDNCITVAFHRLAENPGEPARLFGFVRTTEPLEVGQTVELHGQVLTVDRDDSGRVTVGYAYRVTPSAGGSKPGPPSPPPPAPGGAGVTGSSGPGFDLPGGIDQAGILDDLEVDE